MDTPQARPRRLLPYRLTPLMSVLLLAACAHQPDLPDAPLLQAEQLASQQSLAGARQDSWPVQQWWNRYQDPQLDSLMTQALADSPSLAAARARLAQAQGAARQVGAVLGPDISASGAITQQKISYNNGNDMVPRDWNTYGSGLLGFSYELDFWGKHHAEVAAARSELAAAQAQQADARRLLTTGLAQAYVELARLYANRDTAATALKIRQETVILFQDRQRNGLETLGSVRQVESLAATAEANLLAIDEAIGLQRHALAALVGKGPDWGLSLQRPSLAMSSRFGLPAEAGVDLLGHRPDITAARWQVEAAASRVGVAETQFYPNISLSGFIGSQALGLENLGAAGSSAGSIGPAIYLPLFSSGRLEGQLDSARAAYEQAVAGYNATLVTALQQVADAVSSGQALGARLQRTQVAVDAAQQAFDIANHRYQGGLANYLDVLVAEQSLLASQEQLVNLQARALTLDINLVHALGGGSQATSS